MDTEPDVRERSGRKARQIAWFAVVLCLGCVAVLAVRKYLPDFLDDRSDLGEIADEVKRKRPFGRFGKSARAEIAFLVWKRKMSEVVHTFGLTTAVPEVTSIPGWEKTVSRNTTNYIDPVKDTTVLPGEEICAGGTALVILVTTAPSAFSRRAIVRETWGSHGNSRVRIGFLVGMSTDPTVQKSLELENGRYHDIIQDNFIDSYNNLTLKSIALLKWYVQNCPNSSFLVKSDPDTFVNVDLLVSYLDESNTTGVLTGYLCAKCGIRRGANLQWAVPRYMYSNGTYPDFLYGGAYVMSRDVAAKLFAAALDTPVFYLEDVYITGFCARAAGVRPRQFVGSSTYVWDVDRVCPPRLALCHPIGPDDMRSLWKKRGAPKNESYARKILRTFRKRRLFSTSNSPSLKAIQATSLWVPLVRALK